MATEHTPLLAVVRVAPRQRSPRQAIRRFCASPLLLWIAFAFAVTFIVFPHEHPPHNHDGDEGWSWPGHRRRNVTYEQLRQILLDVPSSEKAEEWSRYYTSGPHLAGKNYSQVRLYFLCVSCSQHKSELTCHSGALDKGEVGGIRHQIRDCVL